MEILFSFILLIKLNWWEIFFEFLGFEDGKLNYLVGLVLIKDGNLFVVDKDNYRI